MSTKTTDESQRAAVVRGLWQGLAAPLMLFGSTNPAATPPAVDMSPLPHRTGGTVAQAWQAIGRDLSNAIDKKRRG